MMILSHSSSHLIFYPSLPLMLLLLLLQLTCGDESNVLESEIEVGQFMDKLPVTYRENLEVLDNVLTLDEEWSPIWSEKLKMNVLHEANLVKEFCPSLWDIEGTVDTLHVIKWVKEHCSYSGMYVAFAVKLLSHSVQCLFNRQTIVQLTAIKSMQTDWPVNEINNHLQLLVEDYHMIADRFAVVGVDLTNLISLAKFYDATRKHLVLYTEPSMKIGKETKDKYIKRVKRDADSLYEQLDTDFDLYCDVSQTSSWYDRDSQKSVSLDIEITNDDVVTNQTDVPSSSTQPAEDVPKQNILKKAHQLRRILRNVFDNLLLGKMPLEVWKQIFENNILVKTMK